MKLSDTAVKLAFFGMHREARDIIDFLAICFSVVMSITVGVIAALWVDHVFNASVGFIAGIGSMVLESNLVFSSRSCTATAAERPNRPRSMEACVSPSETRSDKFRGFIDANK